MNEVIKQATPVGQLLLARQRELGYSALKMARSMNMGINTYLRCITAELPSLQHSTKAALKRTLGLPELPEMPEDLDLLTSIVRKPSDADMWEIPRRALVAARACRVPRRVQQYLVSYANRLILHTRSLCPDIMALELSSRMTDYEHAEVHIDIFAWEKGLSKLRLTLEYNYQADRLVYILMEASQKTSEPMVILSAGELTKEAVKLFLTTVIPAFCIRRNVRTAIGPLDSALRAPLKKKYVSKKRRRTNATRGRSRHVAASSSLHSKGPGENAVGG